MDVPTRQTDAMTLSLLFLFPVFANPYIRRLFSAHALSFCVAAVSMYVDRSHSLQHHGHDFRMTLCSAPIMYCMRGHVECSWVGAEHRSGPNERVMNHRAKSSVRSESFGPCAGLESDFFRPVALLCNCPLLGSVSRGEKIGISCGFAD